MGHLEDVSQAYKLVEKPQEEKTHFAVRFVCVSRMLDKTIKTALMTASEIEFKISQIRLGRPVSIPKERSIKIQSMEKFPDTFTVLESLIKYLDFIEYGVHEGWKTV